MFEDWHLQWASYNGGPGRVQRAIKRSGRNGILESVRDDCFLPRETREHVPMILAAIIAKNPAKYGFRGPGRTSAGDRDRAGAAGRVDLRRVAEFAGVTTKLNPQPGASRRWTTPILGDGYELKVPAGSAENVRVQLTSAAPNELNALQ